jgi:hypothetical protein
MRRPDTSMDSKRQFEPAKTLMTLKYLLNVLEMAGLRMSDEVPVGFPPRAASPPADGYERQEGCTWGSPNSHSSRHA